MVEPQIVVLDVAGSSPVGHPILDVVDLLLPCRAQIACRKLTVCPSVKFESGISLCECSTIGSSPVGRYLRKTQKIGSNQLRPRLSFLQENFQSLLAVQTLHHGRDHLAN